MKILHTADWHVGKKLGRIDRLDETAACLDQVVEVARSAQVDLVIVAGDLFDRALPPFASMGLVLQTLQRLADTGAHVVAVAGNHDSAELFEVLAPYLRSARITLGYRPLRPEAGGVVQIASRDGSQTAQVALFPFLHESQVVDFMESAEGWYGSYADRIRAINAHYGAWMAANGGVTSIDLLIGHFMIEGAIPSGSERKLHIGDAFMAGQQALPSEIAYAALGHIHMCQEAPGAPVPARYAGSLLQLDFGERDQEKFVLLVEVDPHRPASVEKVPITGGRKLLRVERKTMEELRALAGTFGDAILDLHVTTEGPSPALSDEVRAFLPNALYVHAVYDRVEADIAERDGRGLDELYAEFHRFRYGADPDSELAEAFNELRHEVGVEL